MGARNSKRSVDISVASKKDKPESDSAEKLERIEEPEVAKQNGTTPRPEESQEGSGDATTTPQVNGDEKSETKEGEKEEKKDDETEKKEPQTPESPVEEQKSPEEDKSSEKKKKDKSKKKWSFRSISFTRKDKTKPNMSKDDSITSDLAKVADAVAEVVEGETAATEEKKENEATVTPAAAEDKKEEEKKESPVAAPLASALSSITAAANTAVEEVKEKVEEKKEEVKCEVVTKASELIEEGKSLVEKTVEQVVSQTSSFVESSSSSVTTTITESSQVITSSSQLIQEVLEIKSDDSPAPPLPASPPPTEAPPPTPVVCQPEHEDVNGGGEGMAEMPEENGLESDPKIVDVEDEEEIPKLNGHNEESPVKQVENIIDAIKSEAIEKTIIAENNGELVTTQDAAAHE